MKVIALLLALSTGATPPAPTIVAVEHIDVLPVAVVAVARADGRPGPCGQRALLAIAAADVDAFLAGRTVATSLLPDEAWPDDDATDATVGPGLLLPLWAGPGLFAGEERVFALSVDAALAKARLTTTKKAHLTWRERQPFLHIATSASVADVKNALQSFVPTAAQLAAFEATAARARLGLARRPGAEALAQVDAQLCLGARAKESTTTMSPAIVRAALSAPLLPG